MCRFHALLFGLSLLPATASAVPLQIPHQGRLLDASGATLDGSHSLGLALYDAAAGGAALWSESQSVEFQNGYFSLALGATAPLDPALFASNDELWLAITIDSGAELPSRLALGSVPFALAAGQASSVAGGGTVDAASISVNGTTVIDSSGRIDWSSIVNAPAGQDTLGDLSCGPDQVARYTDGVWACADAGDHAHHADDITAGVVDVDRLPLGTSADSVAVGDHVHAYADLEGELLFSDPGACGSSRLGAIRYVDDAFEGCTTAGWVLLGAAADGSSARRAARTCKDLHADFPSLGDGLYWIDPAGDDAFRVFCDMTSDGGGWMVFDHDLVGTVIGDKAVETPSELYQRLVYEHTEAQMAAALAAASQTRQFFLKNCQDSLINKEYGTSFTRYETLGGVKVDSVQAFFGGKTPCDFNDSTPRTTSITFANLPFLPIVALWGGDSGAPSEISTFEIGPFMAR